MLIFLCHQCFDLSLSLSLSLRSIKTLKEEEEEEGRWMGRGHAIDRIHCEVGNKMG